MTLGHQVRVDVRANEESEQQGKRKRQQRPRDAPLLLNTFPSCEKTSGGEIQPE